MRDFPERGHQELEVFSPESRILVVGSSCSGKTTLASRVAILLGVPHIELDQLNHLPGWTERPHDELAALVDGATDSKGWVTDGNYVGLRSLLWPKATHLIWLNYPYPVVLYRGLKRTTRRVVTGEQVFSGNRETFAQAFLSKDSVIYYMTRRFRERRRDYGEVFASKEWPLHKTELRSPREAELLLSRLVPA